MHTKSSTKADAQNVANMDINLEIPGAVYHSHSHNTGNPVLFNRILKTSEILIDKDLNTNVSSAAIRINFLAVVGSVTRKKIGGVILQI